MMTHDSSKQQLADALRDVVAEQAKEQAARKAAAPRRAGGGGAMLLAAGLMWGMLGWLWIARPDWLFAPPDLVRLATPEQREAAARYALYLEQARIGRFQAATGRLPQSLAEAGDVEAGVTMRTDADGYVLEAPVNDIVLRLSDRMNADSFLGDAVGRLPRPRQ